MSTILLRGTSRRNAFTRNANADVVPSPSIREAIPRPTLHCGADCPRASHRSPTDSGTPGHTSHVTDSVQRRRDQPPRPWTWADWSFKTSPGASLFQDVISVVLEPVGRDVLFSVRQSHIIDADSFVAASLPHESFGHTVKVNLLIQWDSRRVLDEDPVDPVI